MFLLIFFRFVLDIFFFSEIALSSVENNHFYDGHTYRQTAPIIYKSSIAMIHHHPHQEGQQLWLGPLQHIGGSAHRLDDLCVYNLERKKQ